MLLSELNLEPHADAAIVQPPPLTLLAGRACRRGIAPADKDAVQALVGATTWLHGSSTRRYEGGFRGAWNSAAGRLADLATGEDAPHRNRNACAVAGLALATKVWELGVLSKVEFVAMLDKVAGNGGIDARLRDYARGLAACVREASGPRPRSAIREDDAVALLDAVLGECPVSPDEKSPLVVDVDARGHFVAGGVGLRYEEGRRSRPVTAGNDVGRLLLRLLEDRGGSAPSTAASRLRRALAESRCAFALVGDRNERLVLDPMPIMGAGVRRLIEGRRRRTP